MPRSRLDAEVFALPVDRLREGYYTDAYFNGAKRVLESKGLHPRATMQVFQKTEGAVLGGMDEALAMLRLCSGRFEGEGEARVWVDGWEELAVHALYDGDELSAWETVLTIEGDYSLFAHLETVYLGVLSRRTLVGTNVRRVVEAARGKPILFFPARFDHYRVQTGDGYAAHVAGAIGVSTDAQASWWGGKGIGTVPHALIAAYGGDTVAATAAFADIHHPEVNVTALVDWDNDCVATSLACARAWASGSGGCGWTRARRWSTGPCGTRWACSAPTGWRRSSSAPCAARSTTRASSTSTSSSAAGSTRSASGASRRPACRPTPTGSGAACCAATPTSRRTSSWSRTGRAPRSVGGTAPTPVSSA